MLTHCGPGLLMEETDGSFVERILFMSNQPVLNRMDNASPYVGAIFNKLEGYKDYRE